MALEGRRIPASRGSLALIIGLQLARKTMLNPRGGFMWSAWPFAIFYVTSVGVLPHKSTDDSVTDVQVITDIATGHPCLVCSNNLQCGLIRQSTHWHVKNNLASTLVVYRG